MYLSFCICARWLPYGGTLLTYFPTVPDRLGYKNKTSISKVGFGVLSPQPIGTNQNSPALTFHVYKPHSKKQRSKILQDFWQVRQAKLRAN